MISRRVWRDRSGRFTFRRAVKSQQRPSSASSYKAVRCGKAVETVNHLCRRSGRPSWRRALTLDRSICCNFELVRIFCLLSLSCEPKASAKATGQILLKFTRNLYFRCKTFYLDIFVKINPHFGQKLKRFRVCFRNRDVSITYTIYHIIVEILT